MTTPPELTLEDLVQRAAQLAYTLYEGREVPHRSCGIAIAETFGRETRPYQALRRGGLTGCGECGAIKAGELILGELLGDPDPTGPPTPALLQAAAAYRARWQARIAPGPGGTIICNDLTAPFPDFRSPERHAACTHLAAEVAAAVAETLAEHGWSGPLRPDPTAP